MFSTKLNYLTVWTKRLKILAVQNASPAYLSTSALKFHIIKVKLDNDLDEKISTKQLRVNKTKYNENL